MKDIDINLQDAVAQEIFKIKLPTADALRAQNDDDDESISSIAMNATADKFLLFSILFNASTCTLKRVRTKMRRRRHDTALMLFMQLTIANTLLALRTRLAAFAFPAFPAGSLTQLKHNYNGVN